MISLPTEGKAGPPMPGLRAPHWPPLSAPILSARESRATRSAARASSDAVGSQMGHDAIVALDWHHDHSSGPPGLAEAPSAGTWDSPLAPRTSKNSVAACTVEDAATTAANTRRILPSGNRTNDTTTTMTTTEWTPRVPLVVKSYLFVWCGHSKCGGYST